ncbi:hypothetical protein M3P05_09715 [Sansalvadorimonas sp. 2012CJ34-2]|uniref:Uncharacterized protein n=1 Tax=Parendozoicomonas callyspongiae TaxID=2942213 RepID=A0ABT0PG18_9GAMM|nr:hypothetical protein [Sansalvadorimonas sp. 2012CJ34-2]MCL6270201.1 hypothetical protein [Sansalvadorimonas sp. 2012CJ34-2]
MFSAPSRISALLSLFLLTQLCISPTAFSVLSSDPQFDEKLTESLPPDLAHHIQDNEQSHRRITLFPGDENWITTSSDDSPEEQLQIKKIRLCLNRATGSQLHTYGLPKTYWLIYLPTDDVSFSVTGHSHDLSLLFRIDCSDTGATFTTHWESDYIEESWSHTAWLVSIGHTSASKPSFALPLIILTSLPRISLQMRHYLVSGQVNYLNQMAANWHLEKEELLRVITQVQDIHHIPGSDRTKHSIIAEKLEVAARNAHAYAMGLSAMAKAEPKLNHPVDFYLDNRPVQAKCYSTPAATVKAISDHWEKYKKDARFYNGLYMVPRDRHDQLRKVIHSAKETETRSRLEQILRQSGATRLDDLIVPGVADYIDLKASQIPGTVSELEEEYMTLYLATYRQLFRAMFFRHLLTGAMSGATLEYIHYVIENVFNLTVKDQRTPTQRIIGHAAYDAIASSGTFLLHAKTGLPAPICGAIINSSLRIINNNLRNALYEDENDIFISGTINVLGEEFFSEAGATALRNTRGGQIAGALGGLMIWKWLTYLRG